MTPGRISGVIFISGAVLLSLALFFCSEPDKPKQESPFLNVYGKAEYVGIQTCRQCHEDKYSTFIHTGMGSSFASASPGKSSAVFENIRPVFDSFLNLFYYPFWRDSAFYIREFRLNGKDTVHNRTEKVDYIIGSGHHTNSHFTSSNGFIRQLPLTWYAQEKKWDLPPGYEKGNNIRFARKIDVECMSCHNGMPQMMDGSSYRFARVPEGIDCERCHGPGSIHVNRIRSGIAVNTATETDFSIVNPRKLPWKLQVDVCQRCHLQGNALLRPGKSFTDFRPGMPLTDVFNVFVESKNEDGGFIMASHAERLQMSKCFISSNKNPSDVYQPGMNFTCITCHNPHVSVRATNTAVFNAVCTNCHNGQSGKKTCAEKPDRRSKSGDNCVSCHMPRSGASDIPHVTVHDHYIRKPGDKGSSMAKRESLLYCVNNPAIDAPTLAAAYVAYHERFETNKDPQKSPFMQAAAQSLEKGDREMQIHFHYSMMDFPKVCELAKDLNPDAVVQAWTAYRIGMSFDKTGDNIAAQEWLKRSAELDQWNTDFAADLAVSLLKSGDIAEAESRLKEIVRLQPANTYAMVNLARCHIRKKDFSSALLLANKAQALDPDQMEILDVFAEIYSATGDRARLKAVLEKMLVLRPGYGKAISLLKNL